MPQNATEKLLCFLEASPSRYHGVEVVRRRLVEAGFVELSESEPWTIEAGGRYFVRRAESALAAFVVPHATARNFQIVACHSDSPGFQVKEEGEISGPGPYLQLNTEKYGSLLDASWLDRPLSVAGKVMVRAGDYLESRLIHLDQDLLLIPSLAIHMNRQANSGMEYNAQVDLLPLFGCGEKGRFRALVADAAGVAEEDVLGSDLFVYNRMPGSVWGASGEFLSAPRLDDLQGVFAGLEGFLQGCHPESVGVFCVLDHEEVGSGTRQGALSTFLRDVLEGFGEARGLSAASYRQMMASSFLLSVDSAHALHPNHPEKADLVNRPVLNGGVVLKFSGSQRYVTDSYGAAVVRELCQRADIPLQLYTNRSDIPGGSTLGNLSSQKLSIPGADVGVALLGMHASYETAGARDTAWLIRLVEEYYRHLIWQETPGLFRLQKEDA